MGGIDFAQPAFLSMPVALACAVRMMSCDQSPACSGDLGIASGVREAKHAVWIGNPGGKPSCIERLSDQKAQQCAQQWLGPQQCEAREDTDELAMPGLRCGLFVHRPSLQAA